MSYPIPDNEAERLNTLRGYGVLDTHPEDRFDDLTQLAAATCGTPIALISLVDEDRQWFKSKTGLEVCQTARADAFCAHAIMSSELFVVPDASQDPRFANSSLVLGAMHVRFYAGAPLSAPNGHHLGALGVIDRVPRQLSRAQLELLRLLARQVMAQVTLGKNLHDLRVALKAREELEHDLQNLIRELQESKARLDTLKNLIPLCAWCKKVCDNQGSWEQVEAYITRSTGVQTTGSICSECIQKYFENVRGEDRSHLT